MQINTHITSFDGSKIFYSKFGNSCSGKKIFFVGGLFSSQMNWYPFIVPYVLDYECILIDIRGHGISEDKTLSPVNVVDTFARDIALILEKEHGEENIIVSLSLGGNVVISAADHFDFSKIDKFISIETTMSPRLSSNPDNNTFRKYSEKIWQNNLDVHEYSFPRIHEYKHYFDVPKQGTDASENLLETIIKVGGTGLYTKFPIGRKIPMQVMKMVFKSAIEFYTHWKSYLCLGAGYQWDNVDYFEKINKIPSKVYMFCGMNNDFVDNDYIISRMQKERPETEFIRFEDSGHDLMVYEAPKFIKELWKAIRGWKRPIK